MSHRIALSALALAAVFSCAHARIEGTQVRDTPDNRAVYEVVRAALAALTARDSDALLALVSTRYFEDNGTPQVEDDYGYEQLKELLPDSLAAAEELFVDVEIQDIVVEGPIAYAYLRYASRVRLVLPAGSSWDSHRDLNRIELAREGDVWKITRGL